MATILSQVLALNRRYMVSCLKTPIRSLIRAVALPGLYFGLYFYSFIKLKSKDSYSLGTIALPSVIQFLCLFNIYHFAYWLVNDKSTGIRSLMRSMGLKKTSYYLGSSIFILITILPFIIAMAITSIHYVLHDSQASEIAILLLFILCAIHISGGIFAISSLITSTSYVAAVIIIVLLESAIHFLILWLVKNSSEAMIPFVLFFASISPFESLRIFCSSYLLCKNCNETKFKPGDGDLDLVAQPLHLILIAMTFWTVVAYSFSWWFDEVCPWQTESTAKSPLFCLKSNNSSDNLDESPEDRVYGDSTFFERSSAGREVGIRLFNLTKCYKSVPVVDDVTFNIYRGETTLLLGHNGAGKTTTMNMILGKLLPDKGGVRISPHTIANGSITSVGVCPQSSVLDEALTVRQHLELFNDIKSSPMSNSEREDHIRQTIKDVSLVGQEQKLPSELSGGMRRKLSLALAFVGKSSILILDEPSSGLDPDSRVFIWNAIRRYRADRTVLLSTQHMEEADYLGDRIAIMNAGKIVCCGSSTFLNQTFGSGYKLRVESPKSRAKEVLAFVRKYFPSSTLVESDQLDSVSKFSRSDDSSVDLVVELTIQDRTKDWEADLVKLLQEFESNSEALHVKSYSLKSSSIEDVMLHTSKSFSSEPSDSVQLTLTSANSYREALASPLKAPPETYFTCQQRFFVALFLKHVIAFRRNPINSLIFRVLFVVAGAYFLSFELGLIGDYSPNLTICLMIMHFAYIPALEKTTSFKTVQLASEVHFITYWAANLAADLLTVALQVVSVIGFILLNLNGSYEILDYSIIFLSFLAVVLFGISSAMIAYIMSTTLTNVRKAIGYFVGLFILSIVANALVRMIRLLVSPNIVWYQQVVRVLFISLFPTDAILYVFQGFRVKCYVKDKYSRSCVESAENSPVALGLLALSAQVVVYTAVLYFIERNNYDLHWYFRWRNIISLGRKQPLFSYHTGEVDQDVKDESEKATQIINGVPSGTFSLVASDLSKSYIRGTKVIDQLSFTVNKNECFGLLGVNGAGKSTTFGMIAAETKPDGGKIWMDGNYVSDDIGRYRQKLGFDPQQNPDLPLTPNDVLVLMARLRCVHEQSISMLVGAVLEVLEMSQHANKLARDLSGGTKRKLALAMSLIGTPSLLALDEPTAGVDPVARRSIWQLLRSLRLQGGASIVISSHAMEECEAICDRISIMARGRLRCIGTFLHLRSKFGQGCTIRVQSGSNKADSSLQEQLVADLSSRLIAAVGDSVRVTDSNINSVTFSVSDRRVRRSKLFEVLREFKKSHLNISYAVNDSSLEDIFIALAREQQQLEQGQ